MPTRPPYPAEYRAELVRLVREIALDNRRTAQDG